MRAAAWLLVCASSGLAQFSDLAPTQDGAEVFFVTPLSQHGSDQFPHSKVFAWSETGLRLLDQRNEISLAGGVVPSPTPTSMVTATQDGSFVSFETGPFCSGGGSSCFTRERYAGYVLDRHSGEEISLSGHVRLSRGGKYALWWKTPQAFLPGVPPSEIEDRTTGSRTALQLSGPGAIASNGTVLFAFGRTGTLVRPDGSQTQLTFPADVSTALINDSGTIALLETSAALLFLNLTSGAIAGSIPDAVMPSLSAAEGKQNGSVGGDGSRTGKLQ